MYLSSPRIYLTLCVIAFLHGQVLTQSNCHVIVNASKSIICPNENVELSAANIVDSIWQNIYQIPGESANGHFGFETVLSDNGLILAVGEPVSSINGTNSGRVRTFKKIFAENNEYWLEIGQLLGETGELCGWSIDLSADGLTMVVGCPGIFSDIGKVKVYKLIDYQWILKGSIIESNFTGGCFSKSVSINGNGNLIAFGGDCSPMVYTYMFQNNVWSLLGNPISVSGRSIELDSSGSRLVIGIESESQAFEGEYVKVYDFINNQWLETHEFNYASNQFSGPVVDMNSSGKIISIAYLFSSNSNGNNNGLVRIFEEMDGIWQQIGNDIIGENQEALGSAISLSNDGKKIALGSRYLINEGGNLDYRGKVATYIFENSNWNLFGGIILGDLPDDGNGLQPVRMTLVPAFSGDGNSLAVGIPGRDFNEINSGLVKIYTLNVPETQYYWSTGETISSIFVSPTETTTYNVTVTQGNQTCTSEVTINVNQPSAINENVTACNTYTWNGNTYTQTGTYTWTGANAAGCDSTVTLDLTILNETESVIEIFACEDYFWNDSLYTRSGTYTIVNNCASQSLILHLNEPQEIYEFIGLGSSYNFSGESLSSSGVFYDTIPRAGLCDSIIKLNLFVIDYPTCAITNSNDSICSFEDCELTIVENNPKIKIYTIKPEILEYAWGNMFGGFSPKNIIVSGLITGIGNSNEIEVGALFSDNNEPNLSNALMVEYTSATQIGNLFYFFFNPETNLDLNKQYFYRTFYILDSDTVFSENYQSIQFYSNEQFNPRLDYGELADIEGNTYKTINIGSQCWMAENLMTNLFSNGDSLKSDISQYFPQGGNGLYNHTNIQDNRNLCPLGTHIPSNEEWNTLLNFTIYNDLNYSSANLATAVQSNLAGNFLPDFSPRSNSSGFSVFTFGDFYEVFWSSTPYDSILYENKKLVFYNGTIFSSNGGGLGYNIETTADRLNQVRCVTDVSISEDQFPSILFTTALSQSNGTYEVAVELQNENDAELFEKGLIVSTYTSINGLSIGLFPEIDITPFPYNDEYQIIKMGSNSENFSVDLENLLPGLKYYARAYVKNRFGIRYGEEISFITDISNALGSSSFLWSTGETTTSITVSPTETTTYSVTVTQGNQTCTSEVTINVNQPSAVSETITACNSYTWNGNTYTQSGTYTWTGNNAAGCDSVVTLNLTITPQPEQPQLACWQTATFNSESCSWVISGTQPTEPTNLACYESAVFNSNICEWEIIGTQPANWYLGGGTVPPPPLPCNASFFFNDVTCEWEVTGTPAPAIVTNASACVSYTWEANGQTYTASGNYSFSSNCQDYTLNLIIAAQPPQPPTACYQTATFNSQICSWVLTGTQPAQPTNLACWQTANFNTTTCSWDVTGTQPALPTGLACYETANFNSQTCSWDVTGTQPAQPTNLACWQSANFNTATCSWDVIGTPAPAIVTNASACVGYTWEANGETYNTSGQYSFNSNCQDYTLNLTINQPSSETINASITEGETYSFNGQNLTTAGTYTANLQNAVGCDSVVTLNLEVIPFVDEFNCTISTSNTELCLGDNVTLTMEVSGQSPAQVLSTSEYNVVGSFAGKTYLVTNNAMTWFEAKTFAENLPFEGATLAVFETLEENNAVDGLTNQYNEWLWFGLFQDLGSSDYAEPFGGWSWVNGAELTYSNWEAGEPNNIGGENFAHLKRYPNGKWNDHYAEVQSKAIIEINAIQSSSYLWNNGETTQSINVSPATTSTFSCTYTSGNQTCTSEVTITVNQPSVATVNATITEGETYSFNGQSLTTAGTYTAALQNAAGCDSTVTLNLSVVPTPPVGCYAATVIDFAQGLNSVGLPVEPARSHAIFALGAPEAVVDGIVNFVSLGFGGSITLAFEAPVANGAGADIRIDEATWGINPCNRYPETADVFASQDGINFVYLGRGCQDMSLDLGPLSWAQFIRIVDVSNILSFRAGSDGYDVNGIECLNGTASITGDDGLVGCSLQEVVSYTPGNRKNGTPVITSRRNPTNALGTPQNNNTINFVSLGFGGTLVAKFDYVVFNQPGSDLRITETSFGNPSCTNYPEKARISMSLDNLNWVELGEICLDGEIDLGTLAYAQYIKIQDASPLSSTRFSGTADGFDVDAVVVLNNGCGSTAARSAEEDNTTTADETPVMEAFPNPMAEETSIRFGNVQAEADIRIELFDAAGRIVLNQNARIDAEQNVVIIPTANLAKGMYHLVVNTGNESFRERLIK